MARTVERHDHQVMDAFTECAGHESQHPGQGHVEQAGGSFVAQKRRDRRSKGDFVAVIGRQITHCGRGAFRNLGSRND